MCSDRQTLQFSHQLCLGLYLGCHVMQCFAQSRYLFFIMIICQIICPFICIFSSIVPVFHIAIELRQF